MKNKYIIQRNILHEQGINQLNILFMKVCSVLFFLPLFSLNLFAQTANKNTEQLLNSGVLAMGNDSVESVPTIYQRDNVPCVEVVIDGKEYLFLFDTGASGCFISSEIAGKANIESSLPIEDAGGKENNTNVAFKNISIGKSSFNNIVCLVVNTERLANLGCVKIDGIIGTSLIKLCNWKLDPTNQMISFSKTAFKKEINSTEFNIEFTDSRLPLVQLSYDQIAFYALIDSGFSDYFQSNDDVLWKSKKYKKLKRNEGFGQYALTAFSIQNSFVSNLKIDSFKMQSGFITNIPATICSCKPTVGSALLKRNVFVYNFLEKKMILTPVNYDTTLNSIFDIGFGLNDTNQLVINFVWENKDTKKAGFKIGQQVLKIDSNEIGKLSYAELCDLKKSLQSKNELRVALLIGKKLKEFVLLKQSSLL
jgi:hypothetical protein